VLARKDSRVRVKQKPKSVAESFNDGMGEALIVSY